MKADKEWLAIGWVNTGGAYYQRRNTLTSKQQRRLNEKGRLPLRVDPWY